MQPEHVTGVDIPLLAYSVEKLGCKVSDFASQVSMRGLRFG